MMMDNSEVRKNPNFEIFLINILSKLVEFLGHTKKDIKDIIQNLNQS